MGCTHVSLTVDNIISVSEITPIVRVSISLLSTKNWAKKAEKPISVEIMIELGEQLMIYYSTD